MLSSGERNCSAFWLKMGFGLALASSVFAISAPPAVARGYYENGRHHHRHAAFAAAVDNPPFSAIVVDENTGRELYGVEENALRHPASITKVMTLYLLFEQLEKGAMTLDTQIPISQHAAAQEPSKLGIAVGDSLRVEDAIKAVVTRSANDVAVAIAEAIGHDKSSFAALMTRKAHALGMSRTLYRNASGLPNDEQWTTARDLTVLAPLGRATLPAVFPLFRDARVRLRRRNHRQPQPPARPGRRRRRHQDRLYARFGLQLAHLGASRRPLAGRGGNGRAHGRRPRPHDGRLDRNAYSRGLEPRPHGGGDRRRRIANRNSGNDAARRVGGNGRASGTAQGDRRVRRGRQRGRTGLGLSQACSPSRETGGGQSGRAPALQGGAGARTATRRGRQASENACQAFRGRLRESRLGRLEERP